MTTKTFKSIKGRVARITRLDDCGTPVVGAASSIVTSGFITVTVGQEMESGEEYTQKNAWGELVINEKEQDYIKWANVSIQFSEVDPDVLDIIGGANPVVVGSDTIGATFGNPASSGAFAIEVWTKKAGQNACAGDVREWGYVVVPFCKNGKIDGDVTIENGPLNLSFMGEGYAATADWGRTPYNDNPLRATAGFPVGDFWGIVVTPSQPPPVTAGATEVFTPGAVMPGDTYPANVDITASSAPEASTLVSLGYVVAAAEVAAWGTGEFFTIGTYQFYWNGTAWAAGVAP